MGVELSEPIQEDYGWGVRAPRDRFWSTFPESQKADVVLLDVVRDGGRMRLYRSYDLDQFYLKAAPK